MVYRVYVEKKSSEALEAKALAADIRNFLGVKGLESLRIVNRYDVENITPELFEQCKRGIFAEPQLDHVSDNLQNTDDCCVFAVEYLPGQFDQSADSAAQCIQIVSQGERPAVRTAKVYIISGVVSDAELTAIENYVVNPVEARLASLEPFATLETKYEIPTEVAVIRLGR